MELTFIIRIFIAGILGGLIGIEREYRAKEAGFRTHFLVALGSALFMVVSQYGFSHILKTSPNVSLDPSRIASQVVSGIGFIGAGTIIFQKHVVRGLTTAAGLWVTSAIGLATGAGLFTVSVASTVLVLICLEVLNYTIQHFGTRHISFSFISPDKAHIDEILLRLKNEKAVLHSYRVKLESFQAKEAYHVSMEIVMKRSKFDNGFIDFISEFDGVTVENIE